MKIRFTLLTLHRLEPRERVRRNGEEGHVCRHEHLGCEQLRENGEKDGRKPEHGDHLRDEQQRIPHLLYGKEQAHEKREHDPERKADEKAENGDAQRIPQIAPDRCAAQRIGLRRRLNGISGEAPVDHVVQVREYGVRAAGRLHCRRNDLPHREESDEPDDRHQPARRDKFPGCPLFLFLRSMTAAHTITPPRSRNGSPQCSHSTPLLLVSERSGDG